MDLDTMLAEAAPARHVCLDGPDSPGAVSLYRRITAQPPAAVPARRRRTALAALTGAVLTAASAGVALAVIPGSPARAPAPPPHPAVAAAAVLARAALTAARQPAVAVPGPGQYIYVETIEGQRNSGTASQPATAGICVQTVQVWAAPDGSGRAVASAPTGPCSDGVIPSQTFPKGQPVDLTVYPRAADLPADPAALEQFIARHFSGGHQDAAAAFEFGGTFLQSGAPPRIRAALYRMIENLPGIESLGPVTDKLGRHGIGVGLTQDGVRDVLIFDPATSAVLERKGIAVAPSRIPVPPGSRRFRVNEVINYTVYKASGVVNSLTAVPSAAGGRPSQGT
jgi:hypothetical protein